LEKKSEARKSQVRWNHLNTNKRAPVMEKEERTGNGTTPRKKRNHKRERKGQIRGGRGREKQEPHPLVGEEIKRPPAGQPSAGHRRRRRSGARQKAKPLAERSDQPATSKNHVLFSTTNHHPAFRLKIDEQSSEFCVLFKISSFSENPLQN
jgi:hypothetical protein